MAVEKEVKDIDEQAAAKKTEAKPEPELATDKVPEHFADCSNCQGTGLDGDALCAVCAGSGKALPSQS